MFSQLPNMRIPEPMHSMYYPVRLGQLQSLHTMHIRILFLINYLLMPDLQHKLSLMPDNLNYMYQMRQASLLAWHQMLKHLS